MGKTFTAPFAQTPKTASGICSAGVDISTNTPANTVLLGTAGVEGAIVTKLTAVPMGTVTASGLYLFISKNSGQTKHVVDTALMSAWTSDVATAAPVSVFERITESTPIRLEASDQLYVGTGVAAAAGVVFNGEWTDY